MKTNFGTSLTRREMKNVIGGYGEYSTCSTSCGGGNSVSSSCAGSCGSNDGVDTYCNGSDGKPYNVSKC